MDVINASARCSGSLCRGLAVGSFVLASSTHVCAQLHPLAQTSPRNAAELRASPLQSEAVNAELGGDAQHALVAAQAAIQADPESAWGYYDRGEALLALRRYDDAVSAIQAAEQHANHRDAWQKSVTIWGQANALAEAGRCAQSAPIYERYAAFVQGLDATAAALAHALAKKQCNPPGGTPSPFSALEAKAADFELAKDHERALDSADTAIRAAPSRAAGHYLRGDALAALGRTDEAVAAYRDAERLYGDGDPPNKALAVWGQAFALKNAGRCDEAQPIFERYAALVASVDPEAAALGHQYAQQGCMPLRTH